MLTLITVGLVSIGGVIERALEIAQWIIIFLIIATLAVFDVLVVPGSA